MSIESQSSDRSAEKRRLPPVVRVLPPLVLGLTGMLLVATMTAPWWWFGTGVLAAAAVALHYLLPEEVGRLRQLLRRPWRLRKLEIVPADVLLEVVCVGIIALTVVGMLGWDVVLGDRPISSDHTAHYTKIWQTKELLFSRSRLLGWSNMWFAGYPANYLYPVGSDLWVLLFYVLGFGLLTFGQAYALAFTSFLFLGGYAVFRLGDRMFGRGVGMLASFFYLTDPGGGKSGGWTWAIEVGVWPNSLSVAFAILAISRLGAIVGGRRWLDVGLFGALMGTSLITHPMQVPLFMMTFVLTSVVVLLCKGGEDGLRAIVRTVIAHAVGGIVSLFWILPFLTSGDFVDKFGAWWLTGYDFGAGLVRESVLYESWGVLVVLGFVGILATLKSSRIFPFLISVICLSFIGVFGASFLDEFHLLSLSESLGHIQYMRAVVVLKPFWFVFSAYALMAVFAFVGSVGGREAGQVSVTGSQSRRLRHIAVRGCAAFMLGVFLAPVALGIAGEVRDKFFASSLPLESERPRRDDRRRMASWIRDNLPTDSFYRIAWSVKGSSNEMMDFATEVRRPMFKMYGGTPTVVYRYKLISHRHDVMLAAGVRYVLFDRKLNERQYKLVHQIGDLYLSEVRAWTPEPFEIVDGSGEVRLERFEDEEIVLRAMPGTTGRLRLPVSHFSRWEAARDGKQLEITATQVGDDERSGFMTVDLAPGQYRFSFEGSAADTAGTVLGIVGALLALVLCLADGRGRVRGRLSLLLGDVESRIVQFLASRGRLLEGVVAALSIVCVGALIAAAAWTPALSPDEDGELVVGKINVQHVRYDFLERLGDAEVGFEGEDGYEECWRLVDRFMCGEGGWRHVAPRPTLLEKYSTHRCISASPRKDGKLVISYPAVDMGDAMLGYYGVARRGRKHDPVIFTVSVDGEEILSERTGRNRRAYWFIKRLPLTARSGEVAFTVSAVRNKWSPFCFYAQVVDLTE